MFEFDSKHYEPKTDDLFLIYTAIDESFNANGWKVEDIDINIKSGLGRPGVIKPKDPSNPSDVNQAGNFIHPEFPGASLIQLLQNQESYSIARAVRLDKPNKDWRVWLQITDPAAKLALKNASTQTDYPKYISPQVITFPADFPDEDAANSYKHWIISHWAFVDIPAYGEKMQMRGNCYGHINDCKIKLQNASTAGYCVKEAIRVLSSSHNSNQQIQSIMSESSNANQSPTTNTTANSQQPSPNQPGAIYSWQPTPNTNTNTQPINQIPAKQESEPGSNNKPGMEQDVNRSPEVNKEEEKESQLNKDLPKDPLQLQQMILTLQQALHEIQKETTALKKDNEARKQAEQRYYAASKVAKYSSNFKSKDAFDKEVDVALRYSAVMSEPELEQYLFDKFGKVQAIVPKSAGVIIPQEHEVPNIQANNASSNSSDNNRKFIELVDMFDKDGGSL